MQPRERAYVGVCDHCGAVEGSYGDRSDLGFFTPSTNPETVNDFIILRKVQLPSGYVVSLCRWCRRLVGARYRGVSTLVAQRECTVNRSLSENPRRVRTAVGVAPGLHNPGQSLRRA